MSYVTVLVVVLFLVGVAICFRSWCKERLSVGEFSNFRQAGDNIVADQTTWHKLGFWGKVTETLPVAYKNEDKDIGYNYSSHPAGQQVKHLASNGGFKQSLDIIFSMDRVANEAGWTESLKPEWQVQREIRDLLEDLLESVRNIESDVQDLVVRGK